jgi:hypothetical protein
MSNTETPEDLTQDQKTENVDTVKASEQSEDDKVKSYLESLKAKLADTEPSEQSEDDKVKSYLESLKAKLADSASASASNEKAPDENSTTISKDYFDGRVRDYLSRNKVKLYILTPCYGGLCHVNYVLKIMETKEALEKMGIKVVLQFIRNESLITRGRNNLVGKAMSDQEMTHILFIDSDITWEPIHVVKLLISDKELVGGIYPIKKYHWDRLSSASINNILERKKSPYNQQLSDTMMIYHNLLHYNFNYLTDQNKIDNNLMEIYTLATGFMMIQRRCIDKMIAAHPQCKYTDDCGFLQGDENRYAYSLFDCAIVNDHYYSEDWLFCHRWRLIGGQIFVDITIDLWHTGQEDYQGRLISTLNIGA